MEVEQYTRNGLTVTIHTDDQPESPREWDNVGTMICSHPRYALGDEQFNSDDYDGWDDLEKYLREERGAVIVLPLNLMDHSGLSMSIGTSRGWDNGQVGFIYCTQGQVDYEWSGDLKLAENYLRGEVKDYDQFLQRDIYGYVVTNPNDDEEIDSCWGLYGLEYAKEQANVVADEYTHPRQSVYALSARELHK